jgi:3'(2'), 5'-bisphosphate nucleotidase
MDDDRARLLELALAAAQEAGRAIMEIYGDDFAVQRKSDASPVTLADVTAEKLILERLRDGAPEIPAVAEEMAEKYGVPETVPRRFWLVDPLDGTKEFIARNGEFTVNIGLIEDGRPVLGVLHVPAQGLLYAGAGPDSAILIDAAGRRRIAARRRPADGIVVLHSRSHANQETLQRYLAALPIAARRVSGSAWKFGLLAAGEGDLYPRFGPTMEWDTAAGQAVLEAAGGSVTTEDGAPLRYGKPGFRNPNFIARGRS